jgi:hypothetical protein
VKSPLGGTVVFGAVIGVESFLVNSFLTAFVDVEPSAMDIGRFEDEGGPVFGGPIFLAVGFRRAG